jgi:thymidylate kinase
VKIGIIGTHGIGKTTLAALMFAHASKTGRRVKLIHEVTRSCPLPINEKFTIKAATWIIAKHIILGIEADACGYDYIICDRTGFDSIIYAINLLPNELKLKRYYRSSPLYKLAERDLRSYDTLIYLQSSGAEILADGRRATNPMFQKQIAKIFDEELHHLGFAFIPYESKSLIDMPCNHISMNSIDIFEKDLSNFFEYVLKKLPTCLPDQSTKFFNLEPYSERVEGKNYD